MLKEETDISENKYTVYATTTRMIRVRCLRANEKNPPNNVMEREENEE